MEYNELISSVDKLEKLKSRKEFVKFFKNDIDDFSDIFIGDYLEKFNSTYYESKNSSTDELFMRVYHKLHGKLKVSFEPDDFLFLKIMVFFESILPDIIKKKSFLLPSYKIKSFNGITALLKTIYALLSGEIDLYVFRTVLSASFGKFTVIYPVLILETKEKIKKHFFVILRNEFVSLFEKN